MTESEARAIEQVRVLWPYLHFSERMEWVDRLRHLFDGDFVTTALTLAGVER